MASDHYATLGVARDATPEDIKRAYRRLARQHHPDANREDPNAEERFKEVTRAYEVLSDRDKRQRYDMFGDEGPGAGFGNFGGISDLFETFFGGMGAQGGRGSGSTRGADVLAEVALTLEEAATGVEREVEVTVLGGCEECGGSGAAPGTAPTRCSECGGAGEVRHMRRTMFGNIVTAAACPRCGGTGREVLEPCPNCGGHGRVTVNETLTVRIPPGVDDGAQLRVSGRGEAGVRGGRSGDLYVSIRVLAHDVFRRAGDDLGCEVTVPMTVAALGGVVEVPTLEGAEELEVAAGTQSGEVIRRRGQGMPRLDGRGRGELVVLLRVETPSDLTEEQAELLRRVADLRGEATGQKGGLFDRIKEAFQ
ncbi:MAG: molecular chaperone DnaJ [Actinomycetota bacterium]